MGKKILGPQPKIDPIFRHFSWTLVTLVGAMALAPSRATDAACARLRSPGVAAGWSTAAAARIPLDLGGTASPGATWGPCRAGGKQKVEKIAWKMLLNGWKIVLDWWAQETKSWKQLIKCDETAGTSKNIREIFRYDIMIWSENGDHHYQKRLEVSSPCLAAPAGHCAPRFALHFVLPGRWVGRNNLNCYNERNLLQLPSGKLT